MPDAHYADPFGLASVIPRPLRRAVADVFQYPTTPWAVGDGFDQFSGSGSGVRDPFELEAGGAHHAYLESWWEHYRDDIVPDRAGGLATGDGGEDSGLGSSPWAELGTGSGLGPLPGSGISPCDKLTLPAQRSWGADCLEYYKGIGSCGDLLPCLEPRTLDDIWDELRDGVDVAAESVRISGADTAQEQLILSAWAILQQNVDLLEWASCFSDGTAALGEAMGEKLFATGVLRVHIEVEDCAGLLAGALDWDQNSFNAYDAPFSLLGWGNSSPTLGGVIQICLSQDPSNPNTFDIMETVYRQGGPTVHRACAIIDLATAFAHELSHIAHAGLSWGLFGGTTDVGQDPSGGLECSRADFIENAFTWALYSRYSVVLGSGCCVEFRDLADRLSVDPVLLGSGGLVRLAVRTQCLR